MIVNGSHCLDNDYKVTNNSRINQNYTPLYRNTFSKKTKKIDAISVKHSYKTLLKSHV